MPLVLLKVINCTAKEKVDDVAYQELSANTQIFISEQISRNETDIERSIRDF